MSFGDFWGQEIAGPVKNGESNEKDLTVYSAVLLEPGPAFSRARFNDAYK